MSYSCFVRDHLQSGEETLGQLSAEKAVALHLTLGLSTEVGELGDIVKKWVIYGKPGTAEHLKEELGDILFYLQGCLNLFGFSMADVMNSNRKKLELRYPAGYTNEAALARRDKKNRATA